MKYCAVARLLAYAFLIQLAAMVYYRVRTWSFGTPFGDSLTEEQRALKERESDKRRRIFWAGVVSAAVIAYYWKPLSGCGCGC